MTGFKTKKVDLGLYASPFTDKSSAFYLWHRKCRAGSIEEIKNFKLIKLNALTK